MALCLRTSARLASRLRFARVCPARYYSTEPEASIDRMTRYPALSAPGLLRLGDYTGTGSVSMCLIEITVCFAITGTLTAAGAGMDFLVSCSAICERTKRTRAAQEWARSQHVSTYCIAMRAIATEHRSGRRNDSRYFAWWRSQSVLV
jgi:hypothetical protein